MHRLAWVLPALAILVAPAISEARFEKGDWELTLVGSGSSDNDFDATTLSANGSLGYFFTDNLEFLVRQGISFADSDSSGSSFNATTVVAADFHFDFDRWQPFVGVLFGAVYGDAVEESLVAGPEAGVKYFVNDTTFILGSVQYQILFEDSDSDLDDGIWVYQLGIGFIW